MHSQDNDISDFLAETEDILSQDKKYSASGSIRTSKIPSPHCITFRTSTSSCISLLSRTLPSDCNLVIFAITYIILVPVTSSKGKDDAVEKYTDNFEWDQEMILR